MLFSKLHWLGIVILVPVALAVGTLGGRWYLGQSAQAGPVTPELDPNAPSDLSPASFSTDAVISNLQSYLRVHAGDDKAYGNLGIWYLQKARETGDPTFYTQADGAIQRALELNPNDLTALSGSGALALSRHQFREALQIGQRAQPLDPYDSSLYGILGDAQIELGEYPDAFATFQKMVDLRPDLTSYARVSYARELRGDRSGAIEAMQEAVLSGAPDSEAVNWARVQLGNLYFDQGDYANAEQTYQAALDSMPDYPYAKAGMGNLRAAQGNYAEAISLYNRAINTMPMPQFVIALGDIYTADGQPQEAAKQYALVKVEEKLFTANGVDVDAEVALFDVDHGNNLPAALLSARAAYERRPSVTVADVLAWTLDRNGDYAEAHGVMTRALHLGTRNALMFYHAAMIDYHLGDMQGARDYLQKALSLNPHFSVLYSASASRLLAQLKDSFLNTDSNMETQ